MRKYVAVTALAALVLVGCSKTDSGSSNTTTTTAKPALTKAQLIEQGDAICKATLQKMNELDLPQTDDEIGAYMDSVLKLQKEQLAQIKALGSPSENASEYEAALAKLEKALGDFEKALPEIKSDPESVMDPDSDLSKEMAAADKAAQDFGFTYCGGDSSSLSEDEKTTGTTK
jgi:hypothetical protein